MLCDSFDLHLVTAYQESIPPESSEFDEVFRGSLRDTLHPYGSEYCSISNYLEAHDPDIVVQLTEPPRIGTITSIVCKKFGVPFVYRYSGDRFVMYRYQQGISFSIKSCLINNIVGRVPLFLANHHIVLGPTGRKRLERRKISSSTIHELPAAINLDRFGSDLNQIPPVAEQVPSERSVVLFVGRLTQMKGIDTIVNAIPKIIEERNDLHFVFVGPGSPPNIPEKYQEYLTAVGPVDPEAIPQYYHYADVFVHPSYVETAGRVVMEAMAAGTPVLARDVGEISVMTDNTFEDEADFVASLVDFESLPIEDISPFSRRNLKERYIHSFEEMCGVSTTES